jgi:sugar phosphate isomerase/epimerase
LNIRVAWEFEPGFVYNKPSEIVNLYEQVGHPNFYVLLDTCHAYLCGVVGARQEGERETVDGGLPGFLDMLSGRIGHVHMVDTDGTLMDEETSRHLPLGKGVIDFETLSPRLRTLPGVEWWCADLAFVPGGWDMLDDALRFLKRLLGGSERESAGDRKPVAN